MFQKQTLLEKDNQNDNDKRDEPVRGISVCVFTDRRENVRVGVDPAPVASEKVRAVTWMPGSDRSLFHSWLDGRHPQVGWRVFGPVAQMSNPGSGEVILLVMRRSEMCRIDSCVCQRQVRRSPVTEKPDRASRTYNGSVRFGRGGTGW